MPDRDAKSRPEVFQGPDGERVRDYQCHSLDVTPPMANSLPLEQHFLLHATSLRATASILCGGFITPSSGRKEIHFADCSYRARQAQYLNSSAGRRGVWILIDSRIATQDGRGWRLPPNGVAGAPGDAGRIPQRCIVSVWEDDAAILAMGDILKETPEIVTQARPPNGVYPAPCQRDRFCEDATIVQISQSGDGSGSPEKRNRARSGPLLIFFRVRQTLGSWARRGLEGPLLGIIMTIRLEADLVVILRAT